VVTMLLDTGSADINLKDKNGKTPLLLASENRLSSIVRLLLKTGNNHVSAKGPCSWPPPLFNNEVFRNGYMPIDRQFLETPSPGDVNVNVQGRQGRTPLWWAAINGDEIVAQMLLDTGKADVSLKDNNRATPLFCASRNGHSHIVKLLLKTGNVDVNARTRAGTTPLFTASYRGYESIVRQLLEAGEVDVNIKYPDANPASCHNGI
jgi:ankyrin repeat domain-containing protein 50